MNMRKLFLLLGLCISMMALQAYSQQSLSDVARKSRATRQANPTARVIDNDIIPASKTPPAPSSDKAKEGDKSDKKADAADEKKADGEDQDKAAPSAAEAEQKKSTDLKKQIESHKKEITQLQRELDVSEREARLRAAAYYADAGTMLRDQGKFAEDTRKQQDEMDAKKQAITDAKQKLEDLLEQARKSGTNVE